MNSQAAVLKHLLGCGRKTGTSREIRTVLPLSDHISQIQIRSDFKIM
jgi:hypothetical protein